MNTVRIGVIAIWAAVGVTGYLSLRGPATDGAEPVQAVLPQSAQATRAQSSSIAAGDRPAGAAPAPKVGSLDQERKPAFEPGTSGLTQPTRTPNQILDALNADIGPEGEYVDPAALAAGLRSDPELGRLLNE